MLAMETEMKTQRSTCGGRGFTKVELLVVICVVAVLVVLLVPAFVAAKNKHSRLNCVSNLKEIAVNFTVWEEDHGGKYPMQISAKDDATMRLVTDGNAYVLWQTMSNYLVTPRILACPEDKQRAETVLFTQNFSDANISYFFSLDGAETYPQMILLGDDNLAVNGVRVRPGILNLWTNASVEWTLERHHGSGNVALADGSVQQIASSSLFQSVRSVQQTGVATNRLVIP